MGRDTISRDVRREAGRRGEGDEGGGETMRREAAGRRCRPASPSPRRPAHIDNFC